MATTDSNGLVILGGSDLMAPLHTAINTVTASVSNYFTGKTPIRQVANATERAALVTSIGVSNITTATPLLVWRGDAPANRQLEFTTDGSNWTYYRSAADTDDIAPVPLSPASGFTATSPIRVQRRGGVVHWTGRVSRTAGAFSSQQTVVSSGTPAWAIPTSFNMSASVTSNGSGSVAYLNVDTVGVVTLAPQASTSGNNFFLNCSYIPTW